jgi:hypothetical protein
LGTVCSQKSLGLDQTHLFWDRWHLLNEVWPKELGLHLFKKVEDGLKKMVYTETLEGYEEAWKSVEASVLQNPTKLTYLRTKFHEKPEMFASFKIAEVEENMEWHGSTHAEQNHDSITSFLGKWCAQDILLQIEKLFTRQWEKLSK